MKCSHSELKDFIQQKAKEIGFHLVGMTSADPIERHNFYKGWLEKNYSGEMSYLKNHEPKKRDPKLVMPNVRSIVCCALSYKTSSENPSQAPKGRGLISNYAWGDDYHEVMHDMLEKLVKVIQSEIPNVQSKIYVDTGPLLERSLAERAGLGWVGKNTCLLNAKYGSYVFLGEILLDVDLIQDAPTTDHCGTCTRCIEACPTDALREPYELDSNRCISYLTIEKRGDFSNDEKAMVRDYICQVVCPWNDKALTPNLESFKPRPGNYMPSLSDLKIMTEDSFKNKRKQSPMNRIRFNGFKRNVEVLLDK